MSESKSPQPFVRHRYLSVPDYTRPVVEVPRAIQERIFRTLTVLYGEQKAAACLGEVVRIMQVHVAHKPAALAQQDQSFDGENRFTERDVVAITYGDLIHSPGKQPLIALREIFDDVFRDTFNTVHLLPFYPYSSDRGFSVVNYREVDPKLGTWEDVSRLGDTMRLMFDGVVNHVSAKSRWFQEFLNGNPDYENFFISFSTSQAISEDHLKLILRPRTSSLLTAFHTLRGTRQVWTTFSPDQVDLNYRNEKVLFRVLDTLLFYVRKGSDIIRLDAATYLWRELGTTCAHLAQTHALIQFFRAVMDFVAPRVGLITETNVPHEDNISYFGNGHDEAHMVYNFALPPLVLWTIHSGDCTYLARWAASLQSPSSVTTFYNFLDSHDGVGLLPVRTILTRDEVQQLVDRTFTHGGLVSMRTNSDGTTTPYELNIPWYNALNAHGQEESADTKINRFLVSRAIALTLKGVAAVYLPSIIGAHVTAETHVDIRDPRSINRNTINTPALYAQLADDSSAAYRISQRFTHMIAVRIRSAAFHPAAPQRVIFASPRIFAFTRQKLDRSALVLCLNNITNTTQVFETSLEKLQTDSWDWEDLLTRERFLAKEGVLRVELPPYGFRWLRAPIRR